MTVVVLLYSFWSKLKYFILFAYQCYGRFSYKKILLCFIFYLQMIAVVLSYYLAFALKLNVVVWLIQSSVSIHQILHQQCQYSPDFDFVREEEYQDHNINLIRLGLCREGGKVRNCFYEKRKSNYFYDLSIEETSSNINNKDKT